MNSQLRSSPHPGLTGYARGVWKTCSDIGNIGQGRDPAKMQVLNNGCGSGRVTRALAQIFGEVHGVDISGQMIRLAKKELAGLRNARVHQNDGKEPHHTRCL